MTSAGLKSNVAVTTGASRRSMGIAHAKSCAPNPSSAPVLIFSNEQFSQESVALGYGILVSKTSDCSAMVIPVHKHSYHENSSMAVWNRPQSPTWSSSRASYLVVFDQLSIFPIFIASNVSRFKI